MPDFEKTEFAFPDEKANAEEAANAVTEAMKLEVVDDTPEVDRNRTPLDKAPADVTDAELERYADPRLKDRLSRLGKGYHEERRAKEAAARERDEAVRMAQAVVEENRKLQGSLANNQTALIDQAKKLVGSELESAKRELKDAQEAFDTEGAVAAQERLMAAKIREERVNNFRPTPLQPVEDVVQTRQQAEPTASVDPKTREWTEQNPWFGSNRKMTAYALSLHEDLVEAGVPVTSDAYYAAINEDVKKRFPEAFSGASADAPTTQRQKTNVVAPATRSTAVQKVVLTQTQVALAKRLGVPLEAYARKVAELARSEQ